MEHQLEPVRKQHDGLFIHELSFFFQLNLFLINKLNGKMTICFKTNKQNNCDICIDPPCHISRLPSAQNIVHPVQTRSLCWSLSEAERTPGSWPGVFVCEGLAHYNKEVLEESKMCCNSLPILKTTTYIILLKAKINPL